MKIYKTIKNTIPILFGLLLSQTIYQGPIDFSYDNSDFSSEINDSTILGGALNVTMNDTASFMMMGVSQTDTNSYDLFIAILRDTIYPVQPRNWEWNVSIWDIPTITSNPLGFPTLALFAPGLDSSFTNQFLSFFSDTSSLGDSIGFDSLSTSLFENLLNDMYFGIQGNISINNISNQIITGTFNCTMVNTSFDFLNINNAEFSFSPLIENNLLINESHFLPQLISLQAAFPNPFNPTTTIPFETEILQKINISIFDITGRKIQTLRDAYYNPGKYKIEFNANDLSSGIYFISLKTSSNLHTQKIVLSK